NQANDRSGRLRQATRPAARDGPAQDLHGPTADGDHDQAGDEQEEEESALHGLNLRGGPAGAIGARDDPVSSSGMNVPLRGGSSQPIPTAFPASPAVVCSREIATRRKD